MGYWMIYRGLLLRILAGSPAAAQECTRIVPINVVDRHTGNQIDPLDSQQLRAHTGHCYGGTACG